ncbi:2-iminobutanoate/2-iminopropanoate deaminase-like isoform X2 [Sardina pilchardus]|uniref:2-iminobutanoate/2-iminopropanoate deaminase-like isoform X2 n=1 Tax=Sardina pilchardus TaxID=27697 RepID=UPI002E0DFBC3
MDAIRRTIPYTPKAPLRQGVNSQAVVVDRTMYISGQLGVDTASGQMVPGGVQAQAKQALTNMGEILKAAGCGYENVFSSNYPARAAYQVAALPRGGLVEIEAVAVVGPITNAFGPNMHKL